MALHYRICRSNMIDEDRIIQCNEPGFIACCKDAHIFNSLHQLNMSIYSVNGPRVF
jgi:hypothetical protein